MTEKKPRTDCRWFQGEKPCVKRKVCWTCEEFEAIPKRALIVKFGAPGDALRTTPILVRLRREGYGEITWVSDSLSREVLSLARNIDRLVVHGPDALVLLATEEFDTVFSLDKDRAAAALAVMARSADKRGFRLTEKGRLDVFDTRADYALRLGMDDDLKFRENKKTVPRITFEMCGYEYAGEEYELDVAVGVSRDHATVALNLGVGPKWPTKAWPRERWIELARLLVGEGYKPFFTGGPAEKAMTEAYAAAAGIPTFGPVPLKEFAARLAACGALITSDSLALHIGIGVKTPVVGLFCSTVAEEIDFFGRGEALVSPKGPCYNPRCANWPGCMGEITAEAVLSVIKRSSLAPLRQRCE